MVLHRCWYRGECAKYPAHSAEEWRRDLYGEQNMNALYDQCARISAREEAPFQWIKV